MENLILPGNPRYQPRQMVPIFGYDNLYQKVAEVEIATLQTLGEIGVIPADELEVLDFLTKEILSISTTEVDEIEKITHHDIRAWVRKAQEIINDKLSRWVHVGLTSYDVIDTGRILQFREAYKVMKSSIREVVLLLIGLVRKFSVQIQTGRTHGQHALPITVGFWFATILNRILYNWQQMDSYSDALVGKISGAVGAHNAQLGLGFTLPNKGKSFEERVLERLNLPPARISTQILPPEPLAFFLFSCCALSATLAQFGRDCRHLMRTEISEVAESFEEGQVGSSTLPHKRNPFKLENLESMWLKTKNEFGKVMDSFISEHQRDLVGSAIARDFPIIVINLQQQLNTLIEKNKDGIPFLNRITVHKDSCERNFKMSQHLVLAEPLYIALQMAGYWRDAHEFVNRVLVPIAQKRKIFLVEVLEEFIQQDPELKEVVGRIPKQVWELLHHPKNYTGDAETKALEIADFAEKEVKRLRR